MALAEGITAIRSIASIKDGGRGSRCGTNRRPRRGVHQLDADGDPLLQLCDHGTHRRSHAAGSRANTRKRWFGLQTDARVLYTKSRWFQIPIALANFMGFDLGFQLRPFVWARWAGFVWASAIPGWICCGES
jgi:hypothetical protein